MSSEDRLAELERKVQYLIDRQEIYDCLVRTSRGNDRFDEALIIGSYHPDGLHEPGSNFGRLEMRDGEWKIALRRTTAEVVMEGEAVLPNGQTPPGSGYVKGNRDRSDPSYQRPLTREGGERW